MSKVSIAGDVNGTGVFTIAAPNGNTNRTITLPDVTATVITDSAGVLNIGAGQIYKDANGNLGLGVVPSAWGSVVKALQIGNSSLVGSSTQMLLSQNYVFNGSTDAYIANGPAAQYYQVGGTHQWRTAPSGTAGAALSFTQAMTLDSSGNLLVGKTAVNNSSTGVYISGNGNADHGMINVARPPNTTMIQIVNSSGNTVVGQISQNGTSTAYNTSSDYRLKNTIAPMTGALDKVALLKPCTYKWNADGSDGQGFIAHELAEVEPGCVSGEKDAVDAEGKPQYQGIDTSFLVATLAAAIQEQQAMLVSLKAIVDAQGAEIASLKGASA
jgi:hypothetical protein